MAYEFILSERLDGVALITLNRPEKLNALSFLLMQELDDALTGYEADDEIKAVILTGAGERAFSAGADIHEMAGLSSEELATRSETRGRISWHIASYSKPLIGAINGLAYGGAALLSLLARSAHRLREDAVPLSRGELWPGQLELVVAGCWSACPKAKELLYTGRVVGAEEAERIGLLNQVVPAAKLLEAASRWAR